MRTLLVHILCIALSEVVLGSADASPPIQDRLQKLSAAGERYLTEELQQALLGLKQVKETMQRQEERHMHLMDALRHSNDKKKGAMQLARETEQKLKEAERQCEDLTKSSFDECRPCLEDTCKAFFTSTCRRGFAAFSFKVEEFFRKMAAQLEPAEQVYDQNRDKADQNKSPQNGTDEGNSDQELLQVEESFSRLLSNISLLCNRSITLVKKMPLVFGPSFPAALDKELRQSPRSGLQGGLTAGFFRTMGLDHILHSMYDFGRNMVEEFSSTADVFDEMQEAEEYFQQSSRDTGSLSPLGQTQSRYMCRRLRREASVCWQLQDLCETCKDYLLKECPSVQQLHSQMEEMYMLVNASRQQYDDRLQLARRHTAETQTWLSGVHDTYDWVSRLSNSTLGPRVFNVITVIPHQQVKNPRPKLDTSVLVTILDSEPITVRVPAELEVDEPAFIQFAAQEALTLYKQHIRGIESDITT